MGIRRGGRNQRGVALVAVLLIFALISVLATGMLNRQRLQINQSINVLGQNQAFQIAMGAELLAQAILKQDFEADRKNNRYVDVDYGNSIIYAELSPPFSVEGQIDDLQGRININGLVNPDTGQPNKDAVDRFERLLMNLGIVDFRVGVLLEWLDPDEQVTHPYGVEDEAYLLRNPPYRAGNAPLRSVSELMLLEGMTKEIYDRLEPFVSVLPPGVNTVNVNTASPEVIASLMPNIPVEQVAAYVKSRPKDGWASVQEFLAGAPFSGQPKLIDVKSQFFQVNARAIFNERTARLVSLIHRDPQNGKMQILYRDQSLKYKIDKKAVSLEQ